MRTPWKSFAVLAALMCVAGACKVEVGKSKTDPSPAPLPVISRFEFTPPTGKAPLSGEFIIETTGAASCAIEPNVRSVSCNGRKAWLITAAGDFVLTATNSSGQSVTSVARVAITTNAAGQAVATVSRVPPDK